MLGKTGVITRYIEAPSVRASMSFEDFASQEIQYENLKKGIFSMLGISVDKKADLYTKRELGPLVESFIGKLVKSYRYQDMSEAQKANSIKLELERLRAIAKRIGKAKAFQDKTNVFSPYERAQWLSLPRNLRRLANDYYREHHNNATVEQLGAYRVGVILGRNLGKIR